MQESFLCASHCNGSAQCADKNAESQIKHDLMTEAGFYTATDGPTHADTLTNTTP